MIAVCGDRRITQQMISNLKMKKTSEPRRDGASFIQRYSKLLNYLNISISNSNDSVVMYSGVGETSRKCAHLVHVH